MKTVTNVVDKEFAKEIYQLIDKQHKEELRRVDYKYRSLKDTIAVVPVLVGGCRSRGSVCER